MAWLLLLHPCWHQRWHTPCRLLAAGGTCRCPGFKERLYQELRPLVPDDYEASEAALPHTLAAIGFGGLHQAAGHRAPMTACSNHSPGHPPPHPSGPAGGHPPAARPRNLRLARRAAAGGLAGLPAAGGVAAGVQAAGGGGLRQVGLMQVGCNVGLGCPGAYSRDPAHVCLAAFYACVCGIGNGVLCMLLNQQAASRRVPLANSDTMRDRQIRRFPSCGNR